MYLQFYFKNGRPPPKDLKEQCLSRLDHLFFAGEGLQIQGDFLQGFHLFVHIKVHS
jgi:hypothetical protein